MKPENTKIPHEYFAKIRKSKSITNQKISKIVGVPVAQIKMLEAGEPHGIPEDGLKRYAMMIGTHPHTYFAAIGYMPDKIITLYKASPPVISEIVDNLLVLREFELREINDVLHKVRRSRPKLTPSEFNTYLQFQMRSKASYERQRV